MTWGRYVLTVLMVLSPHTVKGDASVAPYYAQGKTLSETQSIGLPTGTDPGQIPGHQDPASVPQASLTQETIAGETVQKAAAHPEATLITDTYENRPRFDLDVRTDPLFTEAGKIVENPEKALNVETTTTSHSGKITHHTCTKGYDLSQRKCHWRKVPKQVGTRQIEEKHIVNLSGIALYHSGQDERFFGRRIHRWKKWWHRGHEEIDNQNKNPVLGFKNVFGGSDAVTGKVVDIDQEAITAVNVQGYHGPYITLHYEKSKNSSTHVQGSAYLKVEVVTTKEVPVFELVDTNTCHDLEEITDHGDCEYVWKKCIEGPETRIIEGVEVYADCWAEEAIYQCRQEREDTCKVLLERGCFQVGSQCLQEVGEESDKHCIQWQQTYTCQEDYQLGQTRLKGPAPFCLDGDCTDQSWAPNPDMAESLSKLAIFRQMQKEMDMNARTVFKGQNLACSRAIVNFKDCCKVSGWGQSFGLTTCKAEEKKLAQERRDRKCIRIGTYCAEKVLKVCVRKKTTFCCYPSKLARIIHEQGKAQLGLSFGSPKNPECGGFTLEQLAQLDFSRINLSELFEDLFAKTKIPDTQALTKDIQKSLADKTYQKSDVSITQGRPHGNF